MLVFHWDWSERLEYSVQRLEILVGFPKSQSFSYQKHFPSTRILHLFLLLLLSTGRHGHKPRPLVTTPPGLTAPTLEIWESALTPMFFLQSCFHEQKRCFKNLSKVCPWQHEQKLQPRILAAGSTQSRTGNTLCCHFRELENGRSPFPHSWIGACLWQAFALINFKSMWILDYLGTRAQGIQKQS